MMVPDSKARLEAAVDDLAQLLVGLSLSFVSGLCTLRPG
jgi:hypothetical protein